jgi:chromosome segregation ATPase
VIDDERNRQRARQETRRIPGGPLRSDADPPPSSTRGTDPRLAPGSSRAVASPASTRSEELAQVYRKLGDTQAALADADARAEKAHAESEAADEMVGQMLARVSEVEARLRAAQKQAADADLRAASAKERLEAQSLELKRTAAEADEQRREAEALRARINREHEERESLRARVTEFAAVCEERDTALLREELLEADLTAAREALDAARTEARDAREAQRIEVEETVSALAAERACVAELAEDFEREQNAHEEARSRAEDELASLRAELADLRGRAADPGEGEARLRAALGSALHLLGGLERRELEIARFRTGALSAARNLIEGALGRPPSAVAAPTPEEQQPSESESGVIALPVTDPDTGEDEPTHIFKAVVKRR